MAGKSSAKKTRPRTKAGSDVSAKPAARKPQDIVAPDIVLRLPTDDGLPEIRLNADAVLSLIDFVVIVDQHHPPERRLLPAFSEEWYTGIRKSHAAAFSELGPMQQYVCTRLDSSRSDPKKPAVFRIRHRHSLHYYELPLELVAEALHTAEERGFVTPVLTAAGQPWFDVFLKMRKT